MIDQKSDLLQRFELTKKTNEELMEEIRQYAETNNAYDVPFMQGSTFRTGLQELENYDTLVLTNANRELIMKADTNSQELNFITNSLENHIQHLAEIKRLLNVYYTGKN